MRKIVIAGGSGYLGRLAASHFISSGYEVVTLARKNFPTSSPKESIEVWDGKSPGPWENALSGAEILLNLSGRIVNCRYTKKNKKEILDSRVDSTHALGEAIRKLPAAARPKIWLNSSTATIYRHALDRPQDESSGEIGKGFSVEVAKAWEKSFFEFESLRLRMVALRSAMVFGPPPGGVYEAYRGIAKMGLGAKAGSGKQFVSWVHAKDFLGMLDWIIGNEGLKGPVNLCSPDPRPNQEFMRVLRASLKIRWALPSPEWLLEIGAVFLRTETELLLKSRRVVPTKLLESGYKMRFAKLEDAFADLSQFK